MRSGNSPDRGRPADTGAGRDVGVVLEICTSTAHPGWLRLRSELWPHDTDQAHLAEMASFLAEPDRFVQFVARDRQDNAVGLVEASVRSDYVPGTIASPVAFLEGLYVAPDYRRRKVAAALIEAVADWARSRGFRELASDVPIDNLLSQTVHEKLGFAETERVVFFRKPIA